MNPKKMPAIAQKVTIKIMILVKELPIIPTS